MNKVLDFGKLTPGSPVPAGVCPKCDSLSYLSTPQELAQLRELKDAPPSRVRVVLGIEIPAIAKHIMAYSSKADFSPEFYTPERLANLFISRYVLKLDGAPELHDCFKTWKVTSNVKVIEDVITTPSEWGKTTAVPVDDDRYEGRVSPKQVVTQDDGSSLMRNPNDKELPPTSVATKEEVTELITALESDTPKKKAGTITRPRPTLRETTGKWARDWRYRQGLRPLSKDKIPLTCPDQFMPGDIIYAKGIFESDPAKMFMIVKKATKKKLTYFSGYFSDGKYVCCDGDLNPPATNDSVLDIGRSWFDVNLVARQNGPFSLIDVMLHPARLAKYWEKCTKGVAVGEVAQMARDIKRVAHHLCTCVSRIATTNLIRVCLKDTDPNLVGNTYVLPAEFFGSVVKNDPQRRSRIAKEKKPTAASKAAKVAMDAFAEKTKSAAKQGILRSHIVTTGPKPKFKPYLIGEVLMSRDNPMRLLIVNSTPQVNDRVHGEIGISFNGKAKVPSPVYRAFSRKKDPAYVTTDHVILARPVKVGDKAILHPQRIAKHWHSVTKTMLKEAVAQLLERCKQMMGMFLDVENHDYSGLNASVRHQDHRGNSIVISLPETFLVPVKVSNPVKK